jgi:polysaccharide export outer membrane protein
MKLNRRKLPLLSGAMAVLAVILVGCYNTTKLPNNSDISYQIMPIDEHYVDLIEPDEMAHQPFIGPEIPYDYVIGAGDTIRVNLNVIDPTGDGGLLRIIPQARTPALSTENLFLVSADGHVNVPYAGRIKVGGMQLLELRQMLAAIMKKYFLKPQLEVAVEKFAHGRAVITGDVATPKEVILDEKPLTVMQLLQQAGGVLTSADHKRATLKRANGRSESLNLYALLFDGDQQYNKVLQAGDVIHVPRSHGNKLFITGEILTPKSVVMERDNITLTEVIDVVGGLNNITADPESVYVLREMPRLEGEKIDVEIFQLDASDPRAYVYGDQFTMQPRDVVYVVSRDIADWSRFINQLLPMGLAAFAQPSPYIVN